MDSFQKRQRERKKIEKRAEKEARRRDRVDVPGVNAYETAFDPASDPSAPSAPRAPQPPTTATPTTEPQATPP